MGDVKPGFRYGGKTRYLITEKQAILADALYELRVSGRFVDSNFTAEYVEAVIRLIGPDLFTSVRYVKKMMMNIRANYRIVQHILATSGFSWDPKKSCVVADDPVWDAYLTAHPIANRWRSQPLPYYDKLCIIFGDDKSRVVQTNVLEGVDKNQISPCVEAKDLMDEGDGFSTHGVNETTGCKRKRYEATDLMAEKLATLSVNEATDFMDKVMTQMNDLSTPTVDKRLKTMSWINRRAPVSFMYDRLSEDEKNRMAQLVARGYIN